MLKPYSTRNEFLLTLIAGSICATMHYVLIQPEHFEESVNVFAVIGLIVMFGEWLVFPARAAQKEGNKLLSISVAVVWVCLISAAGNFTSGAFSSASEISPWPILVGVAFVSPFTFKSLAMSDEKFREHYGYVPEHADPVPVYAMITSLLLSITCLVLLFFGHVSYIIVAVVSAGLLVQQDAQKEFYRHHPMWPQLILIAIYGGIWGYTLRYLNNI